MRGAVQEPCCPALSPSLLLVSGPLCLNTAAQALPSASGLTLSSQNAKLWGERKGNLSQAPGSSWRGGGSDFPGPICPASPLLSAVGLDFEGAATSLWNDEGYRAASQGHAQSSHRVITTRHTIPENNQATGSSPSYPPAQSGQPLSPASQALGCPFKIRTSCISAQIL